MFFSSHLGYLFPSPHSIFIFTLACPFPLFSEYLWEFDKSYQTSRVYILRTTLPAQIINQNPPPLIWFHPFTFHGGQGRFFDCDWSQIESLLFIPTNGNVDDESKTRKLPYSSCTQKCLSIETTLYRFYLSKDKLFSCLTFQYFPSLIAQRRINFTSKRMFSSYFVLRHPSISFENVNSYLLCVSLWLFCIETFSRGRASERYVNNNIVKSEYNVSHASEEVEAETLAGSKKKRRKTWMMRMRISFLCVNKSLICNIIDLKRLKCTLFQCCLVWCCCCWISFRVENIQTMSKLMICTWLCWN